MRRATYILIANLIITIIPILCYSQRAQPSSSQDVGPQKTSKASRDSQDSLNQDIQLLAPYLNQPEKTITATIKADRLLSEGDVYAVRPSARITGVWIAAEVEGQLLHSSQRDLNGATLAETLEKFREAADAMVPILEKSKPDSSIIIPRGADYGIQAISLEGSASEILEVRRFVTGASIENVRLAESGPVSSKRQQFKDVQPLISATTVAVSNKPRKFLPNQGTVYAGSTIGSNNREYRYMAHWVRWDNKESIYDFSPDDVYEHQLVLLKNKSGFGGTYLREFGELERPQWSASWVGGYLDTQILNNHDADGNPSEADFTIGCYYPRLFLKAGQWYYLWAIFEKGDTPSNYAKLTGQVRTLSPDCPFDRSRQYYCVGLTNSGATQWIINTRKLTVPTAGQKWFRPQITSTRALTSAFANEQFFVQIDGGGLDSSKLRVVVTGPGCETYGSCQVTGSVLRRFGKVTATQIEKVPLTLSSGAFKIHVDNGEPFKDLQEQKKEGWPITVQSSRIPTPSITGVDYMSAPIGGTRFMLRVRGIFDPARVRVVVTGPGCQTFGACAVSNSVLKDFGVVNASLIERVPLTLSPGSYLLYVQNGSSVRDPVSRGTGISVLVPANINPVVSKVSLLTEAISGKEFRARVDGRNFDINVVRVVVTGPGCASFGSCVVPNNILKRFGSVSNTRLGAVPLTLGAGTYRIYVQNGTSKGSPASSGYAITVNYPALDLTKVTPLTTPRRGRQFFARLQGRGFDSNRIQVVVTGPGCPYFGMCVVPNNVLRRFGSVSSTRINKAPLTLGKGTYQVHVQNGTSFRDAVSRGIKLSVK